MKKVLLACIMSISVTSIAQTIQSCPTAPIWINIGIANELNTVMGMEGSMVMDLNLQRPNSKSDKLMKETFLLIKNKLSSSSTINLSALDALAGKITFSKAGFPIGTAKKAAENSDFDQFVKIEVSVTAGTITTSTSSTTLSSTTISTGNAVLTGPAVVSGVKVSNENIKLKPQVAVYLKFFDAEGKTIDKLSGKYKHTSNVEINQNSLSAKGWKYTEIQDAELIPYYYFLDMAMNDLIANLKAENK